MRGWQVQRQALQRHHRRRLAASLRQVPLAGRLDPVLLLVLLALIAMGVAGGWLAAEAGTRLGLFDPPLLRAVPDDRLLVNLRDGLAEAPLTAGAAHEAEGALYLVQRDGRLHRFDIATGLWSTTHPFGAASGLPAPLSALQTGCGHPPGADPAGCADPQALWALGSDGGVARREGGSWRALIPETAFLGRDGEPVDGSELSAAAVSEDRRRLVVGTRAGEIGLFAIDRQAWVALPEAAVAALPEAPIAHLRWWHGRFWIGSRKGLHNLVWTDDALSLSAVPGFGHPVRDLDVDGARGLLVLEDRPCRNRATGCRRLSRLGDPDTAPDRLVDETALFPALDLAGLIMAGRQGGSVVVMGEAGVHRYDRGSHAWHRLDHRPVDLAHSAAAGSDLYYAAGTAVRRVSGGAVAETGWTLPEGRPVQFADGPDAAMLVLDEAGAIHALRPAGEVETVFDPGRTGLDPAGFDRAVASGDRVLLIGAGDALLHNVARRTYRRIPGRGLEPWLRDPETRLQPSGDRVYGLVPRGDRVAIAALDLAAAASAQDDMSGPVATLPAPVSAVRDWNHAGLSLIDGTGAARLVAAGGEEALTGPPAPGLAFEGVDDVWATDSRLYVAAGGSVRAYELERRGWTEPLSGTRGVGAVVGLDGSGPEVLARTIDGHVVALDPFSARIGGGSPMPMEQADITDVRRHGEGLFLAGAGRVVRYDLAARRMSESWEFGNDEPVRLVAVLGERPVSLNREQLRIGARPVLGSGDPVHDAFVHQERIWTVRRAGGSAPEGEGASGSGSGRDGHLYLMGHPLAAPFSGSPTCLFRQPRTAPEVTRIIDAAEIMPGTIAVLTDAGIWFYSETARSWQKTVFADRPREERPPRDGDRVYALGNHMLVVRGVPGGRSLELVDTSLIGSPDSCSTVPAWLPAERIAARDVAVDADGGAFAWLGEDGAVHRWHRGRVEAVLPPVGDGPRAGDLRRLFAREDRLYATADRAIWSYRHDRRVWRRYDLTVDGRPLAADADLVLVESQDGNRETVTATMAGGETAIGVLAPGQAGPVALESLMVPDITTFGPGAAHLMDVQQRHGLWMFLLPDRLKALHPDRLLWAPDLVFPTPDESRRLGDIAGNLVVEDEAGSRWWIGRPGGFQGVGDNFAADRVFHTYRPRPEETTLLASDPEVGVVRLRPDGAVLTCPLGGDTLACSLHGGPDIPLDPDGVRAAFGWNGRLALLTAEGPRLIDRRGHREIAVTGPATALSAAPDRAWAPAEGLWLLAGGQLARLGPDGDAALLADGIDDLRRDRWDFLWAVGAEGPQRWGRGRLLSVDASFGLSEAETPAASGLLPGHSAWLRTTGGALIYGGIDGPVRLDLPDGAGEVETVLAVEGGGVLARLNDGRVLAGAPGRPLAPTDRPVPHPDRPLRTVADSWADLLRLAVARDDGTTVFDPVLRLAVAPDTLGLYIQRPSGVESLAPDAGDALVPGVSLDTSWLDWDREARRFRLRTTRGTVAMAPEALIREGRLIFGVPGRVMADRLDLLLHANSYGVWTFAAADLDLDDADMLVRLLPLDDPVAFAHGAVLTAEGWLPPGRDEVMPGPPPRQIRLGDAVLEENMRGRRVRGWIAGETEGARRPAFAADGGFAWDRRRGLAFDAGRLMLETAAGRMPVDGLDIEPTPAAGEREPPEPELLVDTARWRWQRRADGIVVGLKADPFGFALTRDGGLGFTGDRLRSAAAFGGRLMVLTEAALLDAPRAAEIGEATTRRHPPAPGIARMQALAGPAGVTRLYGWSGEAVWLWHADTGRFEAVPSGDDPARNRLLAEAGPLRVSVDDGAVRAALRVADPGPEPGPGRWQSITIAEGRFPFDRVTGLAGNPGHVFVASPVGLQVYDRQEAFDLDRMAALVAFPDEESSPSPTIAGLGVPQGGEGAVRLRTHGECRLTMDGRNFRPCPDALANAPLLRGAAPFWRWVRHPERGVVGSYLDARGRPIETPVRFVEGRFAHDRLDDFVACGEVSAAIWRNGLVSVHAGPRLSLLSRPAILDPLPSRPTATMCVREAIDGPDGRLAAGLHVALAGDGLARIAGSALEPVAPDAAALLRPRSDDRLVFERGRLRLIAAEGRPGFRFQHRDADGSWRDLRWLGDRLAIDRPDAIAFAAGRVWLATPDGIIPLAPTQEAGLRLDPDTVPLMPLPAAQGCTVSDLRVEADQTAALRCNGAGDAVYRMSLTEAGGQADVARRLDADPFATVELVAPQSDRDWRWTLEDRRRGRPGNLTIARSGTPVELADGRFDFDGPTSVAVSGVGTVHIATEAGAWYAAEAGSFDLSDLRRADEARSPGRTVRVSVARRQAGRLLCVEREPGGGALIDRAGDVAGRLAACSDDRGSDGLWAYAQEPDGSLGIAAHGRAGRPAERRLAEGRFADGRAIGPPMPYRRDDATMPEVLVPTPAGVLALAADGRPAGIYAPPFPGLPAAAVPHAVTVLPDHGPVYVGTEGLRALDTGRPVACAGLAGLIDTLPPGSTVTGLGRAAGGRLSVTWRRAEETRPDWAHVGCAAESVPDFRTLRLDAGGWRRFFENRAAWGDPPSDLALSIDPERITLRTSAGAFSMVPPGDAPLIAALPAGRSLYLVTAENIYELALPMAMVRAFSRSAARPEAP